MVSALLWYAQFMCVCVHVEGCLCKGELQRGLKESAENSCKSFSLWDRSLCQVLVWNGPKMVLVADVTGRKRCRLTSWCWQRDNHRVRESQDRSPVLYVGKKGRQGRDARYHQSDRAQYPSFSCTDENSDILLSIVTYRVLQGLRPSLGSANCVNR